MTWSIIARDKATGQFGIAVATRFFAVGARVPHIAAGIGAIATQALVNPYYGIDGLKLLRQGRKPGEIIETLLAADAGHQSRQLHVMDAGGRIAAYTGPECIDWCGQIEGDRFSIAGNMLAGGRDPAEILASVKNGIYAANFGGGQVDITSGKYVFQCTEAYKIENGKIGAPLKGAMLIGNGPTDLHRITMVGNDLALDSGIGTCGKNGQGVPVGVGQPTLRMERITVGGTGS